MSDSTEAAERMRREWDAQERAILEERAGAAQNDGRVDEYRLLARVLRNPPIDPIPDDFASRMAVQAEGRNVASERLEAWLQAGLLALLGAGSIGTVVFVGLRWPQLLDYLVPESATGSVPVWVGAILACMALSSLIDRFLRRNDPLSR